jgi:porphobilinogen synthase
MFFPNIRLRRMRSSSFSRDLISENSVSVKDFIYPIFICEGKKIKQPISSMPGVYRLSLDFVLDSCKEAYDLGIPVVALFPIINNSLKSNNAKESYNMNGLLQKSVAKIKHLLPNLGIMTDVALDGYTISGHDGIVNKNGYVSNDISVNTLVKQALSQAVAGSDFLAPSDMMDGRILSVRKALEDKKFHNIKIISYSVKYASNFYGPFRDALGSTANLKSKNKKQYQMDIANIKESMKEIELDIIEGADMSIIKPGLPYLDVIYNANKNFNIPIIAYQVSGEYSMLKYAIENKLLSENAILESIISFKRAGASAIISYFAKHIAYSIKK